MIRILDTTLREGEQTPGVYFDEHIKMAIAELLEEIGIDIIEAGHPAVNHDIYKAVNHIASNSHGVIIGAHSRSLESDIDLAMECGVQFIGIFYCISEERLSKVFKKNMKDAMSQIVKIVRYAKSRNPDIVLRYTPEDTVRTRFEDVLEISTAAVEAGADIISIADTTGYMIPNTKRNLYDYISRFKEELDKRGLHPKIEIHCHNDRGLAVANVLDAFHAGIDIIDTSVLGLGERAGIVDLAQILTILKEDFNQENPWKLNKLCKLYTLVSQHSGISIPHHYPMMGKNAFTHCAGIHTHSAIQNPLYYQSLDPEPLGRKMKIALDHMSGLNSIKYALEQIGEDVTDKEMLMIILKKVKEVGQKGRTVSFSELKYIVKWCRMKFNNRQLVNSR
jgi:2-isopropylmalate synthase